MSGPHLRNLFTALKGRNVLTEEEIIANRAKTQTLLDASFMHGEHDVFKEHLENNPVGQDFKGVLKEGIELVSRGTRTISDVAPTLMVLLQSGAKWGRTAKLTPSKMTPYHVICKNTGDHHELLELMIKELGRKLVNTKDLLGCTALIYAVQNANIKCVETLIANRADVNCSMDNVCDLYNITYDPCTVSPLLESIKLLRLDSPHSPHIMMDIFELLLDNGANVNKPYNLRKYTPVMCAAGIDNAKCVQKLLQKGAQLNPADNWNFAAKSGSVDLLKYLLEDNGIDKNSTDKQGRSVLFWTVNSGNIEAIRYLLNLGVTTTYHIPKKYLEPCNIRGGANVNTRSHDLGLDIALPFEVAVLKGHIYAAEMLLTAGCSCGVHSWHNSHDLKANMTPEMQELLKKWNIHKNNVITLQQKCRMVILNHLSPQADKKIFELPLPSCLVKYLSFPELDDIMDAFKNNSKFNYHYIY